jgi:hypothetical protein
MGDEPDNVECSQPAEVEDDAGKQTTIETKEVNVTKQFQKLEVKHSSTESKDESNSQPSEKTKKDSPTASKHTKKTLVTPPTLKSIRGASVFGSGISFSPTVTKLTKSLTAADPDSILSEPSQTNIFDLASKPSKSWLSNDSSEPSSPPSPSSSSPTTAAASARKRTASEFNKDEGGSDETTTNREEQDESSTLRSSQDIEPPTKLFRSDVGISEPSAAALTGEEKEKTIAKAQAKLYWLNDSDWKERGKGPFKLNRHLDKPASVRLLMWTEGTLRNILNLPLFPDMNISSENKFIRIMAIEERKPVQLAIKFESVSVAAEMREKIMECVEGLKVS